MGRPWLPKGRVIWWRCPRCDLLFVDPQPDARTLDALYADTYYAGAGDCSPRKLAMWSARVRTVERVCRPGRVLDVGCGRGQFLMQALERGWKAWGLEVAVGAVTTLPSALKARIAVGALRDAPFRDASFDALTCFDVVEHVREPVEFLRWGRRFLRPGGTLVVTTPDAGSLKALIKGRRWKYLDFDRYLHLYHFSASTMGRALSAGGFEVVRWFRRRGTPLFVAARKV